jgi:hypothetical protein
MFPQGGERPVYGIPGYKTHVNGDDVMGMKSAEADSGAVSNLQSNALPVCETGGGWDGVCQEGNRIANCFGALPAEKIFKNIFFDCQLRIIVAMLQVAAAAMAIILTGWWYPGRMRLDDLLCFTKKIVFFRLFYGYDYRLICQNMPYKSNLPRGKMGETVTSVDYLCYV